MIPNYPEFAPIQFGLKNELQNFTRQFDPYEDFTFVNLYTWDTNNKAGVSKLFENLVFRIPDYMKAGEYTYTFLGMNEPDSTLKILLGNHSAVELVPQFIVESLKIPEDFIIHEDRESFDYMYSTSALATLRGKALSKKRNLSNTTRNILKDRLHLHSKTTLSSEEKFSMSDIINRWAKATKQPRKNYKFEFIALERLLKNFEDLELVATLCYIDENMNGFSIHEIIDSEYGICHFEKSLNNEFPGINTVLIQEANKYLEDKIAYVNWQQDLGLEGLRKAKLAYRPEYFLRKYTVKANQTQ